MSDGAQDKGRVSGADPASPQFLDIKGYRRKRIIDAAKLLPVLGAAGFLFPLPFFFIGTRNAGPGGATPLALYFFAAWLVLIVAAFILSHVLRNPATRD